ncbi:quinone oxidoreductase-like protein 2 homolog [Contarinia nasturtii]|uniref:quinone oxidoreductase-like protein 2 homolog n=1 Tax=Contarinia nasturtii TaxID=265458 RepID=UPI0012D4A89A|nr:quinone oxidoreductase-like protein 2 homolog [Contarinia nasturtii]
MHTLRLQCQRLNLYQSASHLLEKYVKTSISACRSNLTTKSPNLDDTEQFKAAVLHPKKTNLSIETLVLPETAADGMVRVGIDYCAINNHDVRCIYEDISTVTLPFIPGSEFSGEILEIGPSCKGKFKIGDKVAVLGDKHIGGGVSHQCFVPETECIHIDPRVSQKDAATIVQGYSNALLAFTKYAPIKEGDDIIILAGPGGDGLAAIEIAHNIFKANVHVVFASKSIDGLVRDESAFKAINYNVGLTKVYNFFKNTLGSKQFKGVFDTYDSKMLHVVSDFISSNGYFLTTDTFFSPETFEAPYFKKDTGKQKKKKATIEEIEEEENIDWASRVKQVNITKYQIDDREFYEKIVNQAFDLHANEKIDPFVSQVWNMRDINKAVQFVNLKKCLGKVLIDTQRKKT